MDVTPHHTAHQVLLSRVSLERGWGLGVAHLQQGGVVGLLDEADFNGFVLHTIWRRRRSLCGWVFCWVHRLSWQHFPENSVRRQPVRSSLARNGVRRPELPLRREKETHLFSRSNSNSFGVILGSAPVCCHCFLKHNPQYHTTPTTTKHLLHGGHADDAAAAASVHNNSHLHWQLKLNQ